MAFSDGGRLITMAQTQYKPDVVRAASYMVKLASRDSLDAASGPLCHSCSRINLDYHFSVAQPKETIARHDYIHLGMLVGMSDKPRCSLCQLVVLTVMAELQRRLGNQLTVDQLVEDEDARRLIAADWYLSPCPPSVDRTTYRRSYQLFLRPNVHSDVTVATFSQRDLSWPFSLRMVADRIRGGRQVPVDHLDFSWIKTTFEHCHLSTDMPHPIFKYPLRAIDTKDMCIVDLPTGQPYVALSYAWGKLNMTKLTSANESALRKHGALENFPEIPLTMKDAIEITKRVGQRYLWVDVLCIQQDDLGHLHEQMSQMGTLYNYSYFTIFAISGKDANYGLPGTRPGSRNLNQYIRKVGSLSIANSLPWMEEDELIVSKNDLGLNVDSSSATMA
jgi:Heterokaryon incompatibility protein (HET)